MKRRRVFVVGILVGAILVGVVVSVVTTPELPETPTNVGAWMQPHTAWGDPDFQGVWRYEATIPLERPSEYEGRAFLTDEEVEEVARLERELNDERTGSYQTAQAASWLTDQN